MTRRKTSSADRQEDFDRQQAPSEIEIIAEEVRDLRRVVEHLRQELAEAIRDSTSGSPDADELQLVLGVGVLDEARTALTETMTRLLEEQADRLLTAQTDVLQELLDQILSAQDEFQEQLDAAIKDLLADKSKNKQPVIPFPSETESSADRELSVCTEPAPANLPPTPPDDNSSRTRVNLFEPGEAVEFTIDGREVWGEIVALDDAANSATVLLIPSEEEVTVSQDLLQTEYGSQRDRQPLEPCGGGIQTSIPSKASSGRLF